MAQQKVFLSHHEAETPPPGGIAGAAALTYFVIGRNRVGPDQIPKGQLVAVVALLLMLAFIGDAFWPSNSLLQEDNMTCFALLVLVLGVAKRLMSWQSVKQGKRHSYSHGVSFLGKVSPRADWANRFGDPLLCLAIGFGLYHSALRELGAWFIFAAFCVFKTERDAFLLHRKAQVALLNSQHEGRRVQRNVIEAEPEVIVPSGNEPLGEGLETNMDAFLKAYVRKYR